MATKNNYLVGSEKKILKHDKYDEQTRIFIFSATWSSCFVGRFSFWDKFLMLSETWSHSLKKFCDRLFSSRYNDSFYLLGSFLVTCFVSYFRSIYNVQNYLDSKSNCFIIFQRCTPQFFSRGLLVFVFWAEFCSNFHQIWVRCPWKYLPASSGFVFSNFVLVMSFSSTPKIPFCYCFENGFKNFNLKNKLRRGLEVTF